MSDPIRIMRQRHPPLTKEDFELQRCKERISTGERWQQLLQAHLYLDYVISAILRESFTHPKSIKLSDMAISSKIKLAQAMNLLPDELLPALKFINKIRNKIAHDLSFELGDKDEVDLRNCTPAVLRKIMETDSERTSGPIQFWELMYVVILRVEIIRQQHSFSRFMTKKGELRLRTVLERTPNVVYKE